MDSEHILKVSGLYLKVRIRAETLLIHTQNFGKTMKIICSPITKLQVNLLPRTQINGDLLYGICALILI